MAKKKVSRLADKRGWLDKLEEIAEQSRDLRAQLAAMREIGEIRGFKEAKDFASMPTRERREAVLSVCKPALESLLDVEVIDDLEAPG